MSHRPVTVVLLAWNEWAVTRACLDSLRPTLGRQDQVVVVDNGSRDETPEGLRRYPWVEVLTQQENLGFAAGCNVGAAAARNEVVVFLNNDTLLPARWLEGLLRPFGDPSVVATGPRSNMVSGAQLVQEVSYDATWMGDLQRFARAWRETNRDRVDEVQRLVGFCLAVRRTAFEQVGGFDEGFGLGGFEDDDLCARLAATGGRLLIAHESFVHHAGHATFDGNGVDWEDLQSRNRVRFEDKHRRGIPVQSRPLLSACLIVKDEEALLPACLESLAGVVDEIVVYDTGSTDRTVEIARAAGARVVEGYWDDDFARARNASLAECQGSWVLHIDADETFAGDVPALRQLLQSTSADELSVRIDNLDPTGTEVGFAHRADRLFRRERGHWFGRLHEQVAARPGQRPLVSQLLDEAWIVHVGYRADIVEAKDKLQRNLRIAQGEVDEATGHPALRVMNLARTLAAAGRPEEAVERFAEARRVAVGEPGVLRVTLRHGAQTLLDLGRPREALEWVTELRRLPGSAGMAAFLEGLAHLGLGQHEEALRAMSSLDGPVVDEDGFLVADTALRVNRGLALVATGAWADAAEILRPLVGGPREQAPVWAVLADATFRAGLRLDDLADLLDEVRVTAALGQLLNADPEPADAIAERLWQRRPGDVRLLAFAVRLGPRLGLERALEWAVRLRAAGLDDRCPLLAIARSADSPLRVGAAAIAIGAFADPAAQEIVAELAARLPVAELPAALVTVGTLCPTALPGFVAAGARSPARSLVVARALHELGAEDEALAVFEHGWAQPGPRDDVAAEAAAWLRAAGHTDRALQVQPVS